MDQIVSTCALNIATLNVIHVLDIASIIVVPATLVHFVFVVSTFFVLYSFKTLLELSLTMLAPLVSLLLLQGASITQQHG